MKLGVAEPVPAFKAPAVPHQLQQSFGRGAQDREKEVPLDGGLAVTLAADDQFDDPAATRPGADNELWRLFAPEGPSGISSVTVL